MSRRAGAILLGVVTASALIAVASILIHRSRSTTAPTILASKPIPPLTTNPAGPTSLPAATTKPFASYIDAVRGEYADLPTTQPLSIPLDLPQAAHLVLHHPVYVSVPPGEDLWITCPDARPTEDVLKEAIDPKANPQAHVIREHVAFVHWMPSDNAAWPPHLICRRDDGGGYDVLWASGRRSLPARRDYLWNRAISWNERIVVPCRSGVSVFTLEPHLEESYVELVTSQASPASQPATHPTAPATRSVLGDDGHSQEAQALLDGRGVLAWMPADSKETGGGGAARFVDDHWQRLTPAEGWPDRIVHLVPLLDGSVLQISRTDADATRLDLATLDATAVDENKISQFVDGLSDADPVKRNAAYEQLTRYGPGIWPILEKLMNDQPPEAQARLKQLLHDRVQPTLGGMSLLGDKSLRVAARLADGGVVLYAEQGVSIPNPDGGDPGERAPAWISLRPGRVIELLPESLTTDLTPDRSRLFALGNDWVVSDAAGGYKRFIGNGFINLLRKEEARFTELVGVDHRGRWVFRTPAAASNETLIIDPTLLDPTPRLPAWELPIAESVGWDKENWPVVKHGEAAYALAEKDWRLLDKGERMFTRADEIPPTTLPTTRPVSATGPTTTAVNLPATTQSTEPPLLVTPDGTRYDGGLTDLRVTRNGQTVTWRLPAIANGSSTPHLIGVADGRLFLFNQPGRVLRIRPTPSGAAPFRIEATFTDDIPNVDDPTRIWLDPAGRIDVAWESHLTVLFPSGFIPPEIVEKVQRR